MATLSLKALSNPLQNSLTKQSQRHVSSSKLLYFHPAIQQTARKCSQKSETIFRLGTETSNNQFTQLLRYFQRALKDTDLKTNYSSASQTYECLESHNMENTAGDD